MDTDLVNKVATALWPVNTDYHLKKHTGLDLHDESTWHFVPLTTLLTLFQVRNMELITLETQLHAESLKVIGNGA